jgi:hypothetical protein
VNRRMKPAPAPQYRKAGARPSVALTPGNGFRSIPIPHCEPSGRCVIAGTATPPPVGGPGAYSNRALLPVACVPSPISSPRGWVTAGGELRFLPAFYPVGAGFASNPDPSSPAVLRELPGDRVTG